MVEERRTLKKRLKEAGLSDPLIEAAWPAWWSEDALSSKSAQAELRFTIARKLGLNPKALFRDEVEFVWKDEARFKHLSNETDQEKAVLTSFGISVCRMLARTLPPKPEIQRFDALTLRQSILRNRNCVDLQSLLAACWAIGIPVIHLRMFPLNAKRMHAMTTEAAGRYAILLGRDSSYPAPIAFTLAHELGHIMLGHISDASAIIDFDNSNGRESGDLQEEDADRFALELLVGTTRPDIQTNAKRFNSAQLAESVLRYGPNNQIEPGTLALCFAHSTNLWPIANAAMSYIYTENKPVWQEVNRIAVRELRIEALSDDNADYLRKIMGIANG